MDSFDLELLWREYAKAYDFFTPKFQSDLLERVGKSLSGRILDSGCGVGKIIPFLNSFEDYIGIDSNEEMLKYANRKYLSRSNVNFLKEDVRDVNFEDRYFDSLVSINVLYSLSSLDEVKKYLLENYRLLRSGGDFILVSPKPNFDFGGLMNIVKEEYFKGITEDSNIYDLMYTYEKCNEILSGIVNEFNPLMLENDLIKKLICESGFEILEFSNAYNNELFYIHSKK